MVYEMPAEHVTETPPVVVAPGVGLTALNTTGVVATEQTVPTSAVISSVAGVEAAYVEPERVRPDESISATDDRCLFIVIDLDKGINQHMKR
jgi:hypothetical protein